MSTVQSRIFEDDEDENEDEDERVAAEAFVCFPSEGDCCIK